jgi:hypothetical protein
LILKEALNAELEEQAAPRSHEATHQVQDPYQEKEGSGQGAPRDQKVGAFALR